MWNVTFWSGIDYVAWTETVMCETVIWLEKYISLPWPFFLLESVQFNCISFISIID